MAVELAVVHHEFSVDPLRWFADFAMEEHWHSADAVHHQLLGLIWYICGTGDQLNLGGLAATQELARQIQEYIDSYSGLDNMSWSNSRFDSGSQRAGETLED